MNIDLGHAKAFGFRFDHPRFASGGPCHERHRFLPTPCVIHHRSAPAGEGDASARRVLLPGLRIVVSGCEGFTDALHLGAAARCDAMLTFDRRFIRLALNSSIKVREP